MKRLTDEQFAEELITSPHEADISEDSESAAFRAALFSYRTESLQWAERRSAVQPSLVAAARHSERWAALPRWSLATIAFVTIAAGVAHVYEGRDSASGTAISAPAAPVHSAVTSSDEVAADDKLLSSIDAELSYHGRSPIDALDLKRTDSRNVRGSRSNTAEE